MGSFILRRLFQAVGTIFGVMLITFVLFRAMPGDIAAANLGEKATEREKAAWRHRYGYDMPLLVNVHRRILIKDSSQPEPGATRMPPAVADAGESNASEALALILAGADDTSVPPDDRGRTFMGRWHSGLDRQTPISEITHGKSMTLPPPDSAEAPKSPPGPPRLVFTLTSRRKVEVPLTGVTTVGELIDAINRAGGSDLQAEISRLSLGQVFDSQFFRHLRVSATFEARTLNEADGRKLTEIIAQHAPASLALTVPALAIEWTIGLAIAALVAYYRGSLGDKLGVFLSVLFMCVPTLGLMIYGQSLMYSISPKHAFGVTYVQNIYVPIAILVLAGLGSQVRFYRTIILDETNRDYVRTARAKGLPLYDVLFKHVLRNCMLPVLTSLILSVPFLMMGSLLFESYFGIPGLGDLMISAINSRNEPVINGLVFLTSLIYTLGLLLTDISYAIFDPRIRLR
jgi:peptide/nickel transport system permease protein